MMQVLPKWRVTVSLTRQDPPLGHVTLFISDSFLSNVIRKLADIEFEQPPIKIVIEPAAIPNMQNVAVKVHHD